VGKPFIILADGTIDDPRLLAVTADPGLVSQVTAELLRWSVARPHPDGRVVSPPAGRPALRVVGDHEGREP